VTATHSAAGVPAHPAAAPRRILLVAPSPPPYGGMALQARLLEQFLRKDGHSVAFCSSNCRLPNWLGPLNRIPGLRTCLRSAIFVFNLWSQVRRAEVVHIFAASWLYFFLVVYPAVLLGRAYRKRIVVNYRGGEAKPFFRRYGWAAKPAFQLASAITAPSAFLAGIIRERYHVPVSIVRNILDLSAFRFRPRPSLQPKLLIARHLEEIYDIESALKAFRVLQAAYSGASLWIAGGGSQEKYLRNLASQWNLKQVRFLGQVAHEELPAIYDRCDIFLNASRVDNFPGALLEASAAGLVIVSTAAGGIPFIYRDGDTAFLAEPGDWQGLAAAIEKALQSPSLAVEMTKKAAALARSCGWTDVRRALYAAYGVALA
jgi:glycosyltransferase involved in cell wall biosynthesis